MIEIRIPGNPRTRLAALLIALSLFAAMAINSAANRSVWAWAANQDISPGHRVETFDLKKVKVNLFDSSGKYFAESARIVGWQVTRSIKAGELIPFASLTREATALTTQSLPLRISRSDLPIDLTPGQKVDLYALPAATVQNTFDPMLAFASAAVESVDQKSKDLGGDIGIVVAIPKSAMLQVVTAIAGARVLVVRNAF